MTVYICQDKDAACEEFAMLSRCANCPTLKNAALHTQRSAVVPNIQFLYEQLRQLTDGGSESMTHDDALDQIRFLQDQCNIALPVEPTAEPDFYEDVYDLCCAEIKPLVDTGKLPSSVVESLTVLIESFNKAQAVKVKPTAQPVGDAERLDFVCNKPPRYVEYSKNGMYRVYQDHAAPDDECPLWVTMTTKYYATARDAIDAAMAASKIEPAQPESKA